MSAPRRVAVVGGGIAGLAAARELAVGGAEVVVYEAADRLGGKIETSEVGGRPVDAGADAFPARVPHALELCKSLGIEGELVSPATGSASLWLAGRLRPLPGGLLLGVPARLGPLAAAGILSLAGLARAAVEPLLPGEPLQGDEAVGTLIRRRFGPEVHERLVDPLLGGINAGRTEELSVEVGAAQLAAVARRSRSLLLGLRRAQRDAAGPAGPVFLAPRAGVGRLVGALADDLSRRGVALRPGSPVHRLDDLDADAMVVATEAGPAGRLLAGRSPEAAGLIGGMAYASVVLTTLVYPAAAFAHPPVGSGFLVPRVEGRLLTAASFGSNKWPHWSAPGTVVVRASGGRFGDERAMALPDDGLVAAVRDELGLMAGVGGEPVEARVTRWPAAFPQFAPGHLARLARIEVALARDAPAVAIAGAWTRGVGIPACIASGQGAARQVIAALAGAGR